MSTLQRRLFYYGFAASQILFVLALLVEAIQYSPQFAALTNGLSSDSPTCQRFLSSANIVSLLFHVTPSNLVDALFDRPPIATLKTGHVLLQTPLAFIATSWFVFVVIILTRRRASSQLRKISILLAPLTFAKGLIGIPLLIGSLGFAWNNATPIVLFHDEGLEANFPTMMAAGCWFVLSIMCQLLSNGTRLSPIIHAHCQPPDAGASIACGK